VHTVREPTSGTNGDGARRRDVVVVGGGVAGLAAAWRLRDSDVLLLENEDRLGGRAKSVPRDELWLNFGAHLFSGQGSAIHELVGGFGLEDDLLDVPGTKSGMFFKGKSYIPPRAELMPVVLPMNVRERVALARTGLKLRAGVAAWHRAQTAASAESEDTRVARLEAFERGRTFQDFLGRMPTSVDSIFRCATRRSAGEPTELSAGAGISLFGTIWVGKGSDSQGGTWRNIRGGSGRLGQSAERVLGDAVSLGTEVLSIEDRGEDAVVTVRRDGTESRIVARHVVVAVPAPVAYKVVQGLPADVERSLGSISYGPFVSMAIRHGAEGAMPWDGLYALATPDLEFNMLFNHANPLERRTPRPAGGSMMVYSAAGPATEMLGLEPHQIEDRFLAGVYKVYPQLRGAVIETVVQKWPNGNTYRTPGTDFGAMREFSRRPRSVLRFAGDYFDPLAGSMDPAARSGFDAADAILAELAQAGGAAATQTGAAR
jgi:oxygen-dependent protoporphyrinogen oxidase